MSLVRYLLLSLISLLIQTTLAPLFSIRGVQPDFVILVVVGIALREGRLWGTVAGFFLGFGVDATTTQFFGLSALTKAVGGYVAASFETEPAGLGFRRWLEIVGAATLSDRILYYTIFGLGGELGVLKTWLRFSLPATLYTLAFAAIVAALWPGGLLRFRTTKPHHG